MKTCPKCNQTYTDAELYFCLNDGEMLVAANAEPSPTIFMDAPRITNQNWQGTNQNTNFQNQQLTPNHRFNSPMPVIGQNQTLPVISLVLGILSLFCCYLGFPLGIIATVCGYLGIKNINSNPQLYGGNGLAIGGLICGIVGTLMGLGFIILVIISPNK